MSISGFLLSSQLPTCTTHTLGNSSVSMTLLNFLQPRPKVRDDLQREKTRVSFCKGKLEHSADYQLKLQSLLPIWILKYACTTMIMTRNPSSSFLVHVIAELDTMQKKKKNVTVIQSLHSIITWQFKFAHYKLQKKKSMQ